MIPEKKNPLSPLELDAWALLVLRIKKKHSISQVSTAELYTTLNTLMSYLTGHCQKVVTDANTNIRNNI